MAEKKSNAGLVVVLVIMAVGGLFAWPHLQWFRFELEAREVFQDKKGLGRFPQPPEIIAAKDKLIAAAKGKGFDGLQVAMTLEFKKMGGGPVKRWFIRANMTTPDGGHSFVHERMIETEFNSEEELDAFRDAGFTVKH